MATQVGQNQPVARCQLRRNGTPEFMVAGKRVQQHQRSALAPGLIENFRVIRVNLLWHIGSEDNCAETYVPVTAEPVCGEAVCTAAASTFGSSGITIQHTM